jgi:teichuronic acid biosynthesis glycosyltransferase TuaG
MVGFAPRSQRIIVTALHADCDEIPKRMVTQPSPAVSIITPAYNAERFLQATLNSVASQTFSDFEHIIVDDCSSDATARILADTSADPRVRVHRNPTNLGVAAARNAGLDLAQGSFICFLDADDRWLPTKLEQQVAFMHETGVDISYMEYLRTDLNGKPIGRVTPPASCDLSVLLKSNVIGNLTAMARKKAIGNVRFRRIGHEDYVFWLDVLKTSAPARRVPVREPVCLYRVAETSLSGNKLQAAHWQWKVYREVAGLDLSRSAWLFANYIARGILKRV